MLSAAPVALALTVTHHSYFKDVRAALPAILKHSASLFFKPTLERTCDELVLEAVSC